MRSRCKTLLTLFLPALAACAGPKLPDYNVLGALRVITINANPPEVDPAAATSVTLTPLVSDLGSGRAMSYEAVGCVDPGVGFGAPPSCAGVPGETSLGNGTIPDLDSSQHTHTGEAPTLSVTVPAAIFASRSPIDQYNGVSYLVIYTLIATNTDGSTARVTSFKRISATTRPIKNTNPTVADIKSGEISLGDYLFSLTFPSSSSIPLAVVLDPGAVETYTAMSADGTIGNRTELMTTTWFISDGAIQYYRTENTDPNIWTPPSAQPLDASGTARSVFVIAVTRDGRGGEGYKMVEH